MAITTVSSTLTGVTSLEVGQLVSVSSTLVGVTTLAAYATRSTKTAVRSTLIGITTLEATARRSKPQELRGEISSTYEQAQPGDS